MNTDIIIKAFKNSERKESNNRLSYKLLIPNNFDKFLPHLLLLQKGRKHKKIKKVIIVPYRDLSDPRKGKKLISNEIETQPIK